MGLRSDDGPVLSSWKEIAAFFDRDVRTVQRWEKEQDLPVHRHQHSRGTSVYAYEAELAAWWANGEHPAAADASLRRQWLGSRRAVAAAAALAVIASVFAVSGRWDVSPVRATMVAMAGGGPTISFSGAESGPVLAGVRTGDIDGDGADDLIIGYQESDRVTIVRGAEAKVAGGLPGNAAPILTLRSERGAVFPDAVGDYDGDGIDDVIVTERLDERTGYYRSGDAYLVLGRRAWPDEIVVPVEADVTLQIDRRPDVRLRVVSAGDLNGDGIADVVAAAVELKVGDHFSAGAVFVVAGRTMWPRHVALDRDAEVSLVGSGLGHGFGASAATGDFDGDGWLDIAAVASNSTMWNLGGSNGTVYLFTGRARWPARLDAEKDAALRVSDGDHRMFGAEVLLADLDGDGRDELILSQPGDWTLQHAHAGPGEPEFPGRIAIWMGGSRNGERLALDEADITIRGVRPGGQLGGSMAATDLDGDGAAELLLAQPGHGVVLLYGRPRWLRDGTLLDHGAFMLFDAEPSAGTWEIGLADLDGDALREVLIATPESATGAATTTGRVWVLRPYLPVAADYRPLTYPNVVVPGGVGALRLDNLGGLPGEAIDPATVRVAGVPPLAHVERDYDDDGVLEVQVWVENDRLPLTPGQRRVAVTGRTRSGLLLGGSDVVTVLPRLPAISNTSRSPSSD